MIKGLTSHLNEAGKIKIGKKGKMITSKTGKEFRPPQKFDHFRLTTTEKDEDDNYIIDNVLEDHVKENGIVNEKGMITGIPIRLPFNDIESNFPTRYVSYVSGKLTCHGDGESSFKRIDDFVKKHKCPCSRIDIGYEGKDKCKATGTLTCIIDEAQLFGQAHIFRTTSMNSIKGIIGGMSLISHATGGKLAWIPLMLTLAEKNTITPGGIATKVHVVSICYRGNIEDLRLKVIDILETDKRYFIDMEKAEARLIPMIDSEDEQDFVDEFFPENYVEIETSQVKENIVETKITTNPEQQKNNPKKEPRKGSVEPRAEYAVLYDRLLKETKYQKALAIVKRLKLGNIIYWIDNNYPEIQFEDGLKKPAIVKIADNVLKSVFLDNDNEPEDESESKTEREAIKTEETETNTEQKTYVSHWDMSGPIEVEQCRTLVGLKVDLEEYAKKGLIDNFEWVNLVSYFTDKKGNKINKATELTKTQGNTFIQMLKDSMPE